MEGKRKMEDDTALWGEDDGLNKTIDPPVYHHWKASLKNTK